MMDVFVFTGVVVQEASGFSSLCPELDVASSGETLEEAKSMLLEAIALHLEGAFEDGLPYLRPIPNGDDPRSTAPDTVKDVFRFRVDVDVRVHV